MKILKKLLLGQNIENELKLIPAAVHSPRRVIDLKKRRRFTLPFPGAVIFTLKHFLLITIIFVLGSVKTYAQGPTFTYSNPNVYTYGNTVNISPSITSSSGTITWAIDALPAGLSFDTGTGIISGNPSAISAATDYHVTATDGTGTTPTAVTVTIEIDPAPLTITANSQSKTYGTTFSFAGTEFTASGLVNSDNVSSVTLTSAGSAATATVAGGPYAIVPSAAVGSGLSNYTITYVNGSMTVNTAPLTITAKPQSKTYGTTFSFAGTEFTASGLVNSDNVSSVTLTSAGSAASATVAGSPYNIVPSAATGSGLSNYTISYVNGSMTVNTAALTITANAQTKTYGTTFTFAGTEFTTSGLLNSDAVSSATLTSTGSAAMATVAGSPYSIVPSAAVGSGLSNYSITYVNGSMTVSTAALTITANPQTKTYGTTFSFAGTEFTTSGLVNSDAVSSVTLTSAGSAATATVAGSPYSIVPSAAAGSGLSNYTISYVNGSMTVNAAALTITAKPQSKTYGTTFTFAGTEFTTSGLVNSDAVSSVTLTSTGSPATATVAGSPYPIVPSAAVGSGLSNYTISYVNGSMTVNAAALTITANAQSKTYGTTFTFAGTEFTTSGLVNSDAVSSVTLTSTGSPATATVAGSPYPIVPSAAIGTGLSNYTITYVNGSMTVTGKTLTITANNQSKTYGTTFTFAGTEFTVTGLTGSDAVTSVTLTSTGSPATATVAGSPYPIIPSAAVGTGLSNYTITYVNGSMTVTGKTLTITANNQSKTYGTTFTFAGTEFTVTGLAGSDAVTSVTLTSTGSAATATVAGSPYTITPSAAVGSGLSNYSIAYVNGSMTVTAKALTVTGISTITKTYDGSNSATFTGTLNGKVGTDVVTLNGTGTYASVNVGTGIVVTSTATLGGAAAGNYTLTQPTGLTGAITAKALTITGLTKTYDGTTTAATLSGGALTTGATGTTPGDVVPGDNVTLLGTPAGTFPSANVGSYTITISGYSLGGTSAGNYSLTLTVTATITQAPLTITPTTLTKVYGTTEPASVSGQTTFTSTGLVNGETISTVTINYGNKAQSNNEKIGTYTSPFNFTTQASNAAGAGGFIASNYNITYALGTFIVTAAPFDWTDASGDHSWTNANNWNSAGIATTDYPGSLTGGVARTTDVVDIGVNNAFTTGPVLNTSETVSTVLIGSLGTSPINFLNSTSATTLTVSSLFSLNGGAETVNLSSNNTTLNITGNYLAGSGATFNKTNTTPMTIGGTFTNSGTFIQGSSGAVTVTGATTNSGTLTLGSGNFTFSTGDFTNTGTFTAGTGTVFFTNLIGNQKIFGGTGNGGLGTVFNNVTFNSATGPIKLMSGNVGVSSTGIMTLTGSSTNVTNNGATFTLYSSASGSATVAAIPTGCSITGTVNVQRYIAGGTASARGYRLLSPSTYVTADTHGNNIYTIDYLLNSTYISGTAFPSTTSNSHSKTGNPSLYIYRENLVPSYLSFLTSNYRGIETLADANSQFLVNLDSPPSYDIPAGNGYLFFFRGGTGTVNPFSVGSTPASATLSSSGTLNQGSISVTNWYNESLNQTGLLYTTVSGDLTIEGMNLVGNPYPSTIDWNTFSSTNASAGIYGPKLTGTIYLLSPGTQAGGGNYGAYIPGIGGTNNATNLIASGVGFFAQVTQNNASLKFTENAKVSTQVSGSALFLANKRTLAAASQQQIRLQMQLDTINTDETLINFNPSTSAAYNIYEDARYWIGTGKVSLASLSSDNVPLSIDQLPLAPKGDTIGLKVGATASGNYMLKAETITGIPQLYDVWLTDAVAKDSVNLRNNNSYNFAITLTDSTTFGGKRFKLVLKPNPAFLYKLLSFDGQKTGKRQVQLTWTTQNEGNQTQFTIERSTDGGKTFSELGDMTSTGAGTYSFTDPDPLKGDNQYYLKTVDYFGNVTISNMVDEEFQDNGNDKGTSLALYPNPVVSTITLTIVPKSQAKTSYSIMISNSTGLVVKSATTTDLKWQNNVSDLLVGSYLVQVIDNKDSSIIGQVKFVKL